MPRVFGTHVTENITKDGIGGGELVQGGTVLWFVLLRERSFAADVLGQEAGSVSPPAGFFIVHRLQIGLQPDSGASDGFFSPRSLSIRCAMYSCERVLRAT